MRFSFLFHEPAPDLDDLDRRIERLAALGYRGVELSACHPSPYPMAEAAARAARHGLAVVSLLSGWSYAHEGLCLSSPDPAVGDRAVARLGDYVAQAADAGALLVVGLMQGLRSDEPDEATAKDRIAGRLRQVARIAERRGVTVVVEPVNHLQVGFHHSADEVAELIGRVASPALGLMLDTFHANIEEPSVLGAFQFHGPWLRHVHLCETTGGPFGSGHLDVPGVLAALDAAGYGGFVSVKVYRRADWEEAARGAAESLRACGARIG